MANNESFFLKKSLYKRILPWIELARYDKPIGFMLLFWPCVWSLLLYGMISNKVPPFSYLFLFLIGSIVMRGAGCTWNDFLDKDFDKNVDRTKNRPLASGKINTKDAFIFLILQLILGLIILIQFNTLTIILGCLSLAPIFIYPLMKRVTWWPQLFLGITFNWGALLGWLSLSNNLSYYPFFLYLACIFWTVGYDTIYAHQDRGDDIVLGLKSSAIKLGKNTKNALVIFYSIFCFIFSSLILNISNSFLIYALIVSLIIHLFLQIYYLDINNRNNCLKIFKSNNNLGFLISFYLLLEIIVN